MKFASPVSVVLALAATTAVVAASDVAAICGMDAPSPSPTITPARTTTTAPVPDATTVAPAPAATTVAPTSAPTTAAPTLAPATYKIDFLTTERQLNTVEFTEGMCVSLTDCLAASIQVASWEDIGSAHANAVTFFASADCRQSIVTASAKPGSIDFTSSDDLSPPLSFGVVASNDGSGLTGVVHACQAVE